MSLRPKITFSATRKLSTRLYGAPILHTSIIGRGMRRKTTFRSTTYRIYDGGPIRIYHNTTLGWPGSSVGIVTDYGLDVPGSNPGVGPDFPSLSRPALGPTPASCTMRTASFLGIKCGRGVLLTTHPLLVPMSWKSIAMPLSTLWAQPVI
jgi:hypothetical protein